MPRVQIAAPMVPARAASCLDAAVPPVLDVAVLSVGRPDGVYFAGMQLTPWMSFEERMKLGDLEHRLDRTLDRAEKYKTLKRRREGESVVVRWEIEGGLPSVPVELWDVRAADLDHDYRCYAYLWGKSGHVDSYRLAHRLIHETIDLSASGKSSNAYHTQVEKLLDGATTVWVISAAEIVQVAAAVDLRRVAKSYRETCAAARAAGVNVEAILVEVESGVVEE